MLGLLLLLRLSLFFLSSSSSLLSDCCPLLEPSAGFHSSVLSRRLWRAGEWLRRVGCVGEEAAGGEVGCSCGGGGAVVVVVRRRVRDAIVDCGGAGSSPAREAGATLRRVDRRDMVAVVGLCDAVTRRSRCRLRSADKMVECSGESVEV